MPRVSFICCVHAARQFISRAAQRKDVRRWRDADAYVAARERFSDTLMRH